MRDEDLRVALLAASEADWAALSGPEEVPAFSPRYQRWEQRFRRDPRRGGRTAWGPVARRAACFLVVILLSLSSWLAVDAQARDHFLGWRSETRVSDQHFWYRGTTNDDSPIHYELGVLPNGYTMDRREDSGDHARVFYTDGQGHTLCLEQFSRTVRHVYLTTDGRDGVAVSVNGIKGMVYSSPNGDLSLAWRDGGTLLILTGPLDTESLVRYAEGLIEGQID